MCTPVNICGFVYCLVCSDGFSSTSTHMGARVCVYLLMVSCNEPELDVHAVSSLLSSDETEDVLMFHPTQAVHLILVLPGLLILSHIHTTPFIPMTEFPRVINTQTYAPCITWMGKIFTATCSLSSCAFHTQPNRPLALISSNCSGFWPRSGEGGVNPGSCRKTSNSSAFTTCMY